MTSQSAHLIKQQRQQQQKHRRSLKSPIGAFVLSGARVDSIRSSCWMLQWRGPWSIRSLQNWPRGALAEGRWNQWYSNVHRPHQRRARCFLEITWVIPPVVRTDEWDNVRSRSLSHLLSFEASLQWFLSEAVWVGCQRSPRRGNTLVTPRACSIGYHVSEYPLYNPWKDSFFISQPPPQKGWL